MASEPTVRQAEADDAGRIRELVESSMTASYALSPQDIETILEATVAPETLEERVDDETIVLLAELDGTVAGVVEATFVDGGEGAEIHRLHVDAERRGAGVGTALFERVRSDLGERGVDDPRAVTLSANTSAGAFFERFGFGQVGERTVDIGGRETVQYLYAADADADEESAGGTASEKDDGDATTSGDYDGEIPETATGEDGTTLYLGGDPFEGSEGYFVRTFSDEDRSEEYGYYCLHCESGDVSVDEMERVRCGNCGNTRKPDDDYDGAYL